MAAPIRILEIAICQPHHIHQIELVVMVTNRHPVAFSVQKKITLMIFQVNLGVSHLKAIFGNFYSHTWDLSYPNFNGITGGVGTHQQC